MNDGSSGQQSGHNVGAVISRKCLAMSTTLSGAAKPAVMSAALVVKRAVEGSRDAVSSGGRLRNVGRSGAKLGVGFDIVGRTNVTALVQARGPWQIIERDTRAHEIKPRRRGGLQAVTTPDGPRARVINHPGTKGKHPFERGVTVGQPPAEQILTRFLSDAVVRAFKA